MNVKDKNAKYWETFNNQQVNTNAYIRNSANMTYTISDEYSTMGKYSLKCTTSTSWNWLYYGLPSNMLIQITIPFTFKCDVSTTGGQLLIVIIDNALDTTVSLGLSPWCYPLEIIYNNPVSNLNLGCGIADITKYSKYVNIGLGTDGQGSGNNMNLFYHMSLVDLLQKGVYKDPTVFSSFDTLKMATIDSAKSLGVDDIIGSIEVGQLADIIILDLNNIENYPKVDLITNIVHNTESINIDTTIINGEVLMQNHKLMIDINEDELKSKIDSIIGRLL